MCLLKLEREGALQILIRTSTLNNMYTHMDVVVVVVDSRSLTVYMYVYFIFLLFFCFSDVQR